MESDDDRAQETRIGQLITKVIVSLVTAAAIFSAHLGWNLDRTVLDHDARLEHIMENQATLRRQLRCDPLDDPHPICARIDRLDDALKRNHKE